MKHIYINWMNETYLHKLNEWNTFTYMYIIISKHNNISTGDLFTGNCYVSYLDYLYTNAVVVNTYLSICSKHELLLSINNPNFFNWIPLVYLSKFETKETASYTSFLDIYLKFDTICHISTRLKRRLQFW